jgi:succinate dehydrogenase / fumarate reductase cytochrome b subunit
MVRHEFLLRRLHSLTGLVPVGAYMVVHLLTNASVLDSPGTFQENVYRIHGLGSVLWVVEWGFIFLPLIFHAVFGVIIMRGALPNNSNYPYANNWRYTLQRVSGMIAFLFIFWHVFHLHGWFHWNWWIEGVAEPLGGAKFRPYNAASSLRMALEGVVVPSLYAIGVIASVFHLANGIWTMGITWGVWVSEAAQRRASWACLAFGLGLTVVGLSALTGAARLDLGEAFESEERKIEAKTAADLLSAESAEHKRYSEEERQRIEARIAEELEKKSQADDAAPNGETAEATHAAEPSSEIQ